MLSLQTRLSLLDRPKCFEKGFAACIRKKIVPEEDSRHVRHYVKAKFDELLDSIERKDADLIYSLVVDDMLLREFYRVITGTSIEDTGKASLHKMLKETYIALPKAGQAQDS